VDTTAAWLSVGVIFSRFSFCFCFSCSDLDLNWIAFAHLPFRAPIPFCQRFLWVITITTLERRQSSRSPSTWINILSVHGLSFPRFGANRFCFQRLISHINLISALAAQVAWESSWLGAFQMRIVVLSDRRKHRYQVLNCLSPAKKIKTNS